MIQIEESSTLHPGPLHWGVAKLDGQLTARVSCSNGHVGILTDHTIDYDGKVNPSLVCPEDGCGFHEFVQLNGWKPE